MVTAHAFRSKASLVLGVAKREPVGHEFIVHDVGQGAIHLVAEGWDEVIGEDAVVTEDDELGFDVLSPLLFSLFDHSGTGNDVAGAIFDEVVDRLTLQYC